MLLIVCVYLITSIAIFRNSLFSSGVINGEDSANPINTNQVSKILEMNFSTWDFNNAVEYRSYISGAATLINFTQYIFSKIGIVEKFPSIFFIAIFTIAACGIYKLLLRFNINKKVCLFSGLFYITSPIFFNYSIFGWNFVLLSCALMPWATLYYIDGIENKSLYKIILSGLLFAIAFVQSQSLIWFIIIYVAATLVFSYNLLKDFFKLLTVICICIILNIHTILPIIIYPNEIISGTSYTSSPASIGTTAHFIPSNTIKQWGGLFNFQYESIINNYKFGTVLYFFSIISIISVFFKISVHERKLFIFSSLLALIPILIMVLISNRWLLNYIPFSNIIRDLARFITISNFGYVILVSLGINTIYNYLNKTYIKNSFTFFIFLLSIFYMYPWLNNEIDNYDENKTTYDSRLRYQNINNDYEEVENFLLNDPDDFKVIYLPVSFNSTVISNRDKQYKFGQRDIYAMYSPKPGLFSITDRALGNQNYSSYIYNSLLSGGDPLDDTNFKYLIVRNDLSPVEIHNLGSDNNNRIIINIKNRYPTVFKNDSISIFKNENFKPKIYLKDSVNGNIIESTYKKINETKFLITANNVPQKFDVIFNTSSHPLWEFNAVFINDNFKHNIISSSKNLLLDNTYDANIWKVDLLNPKFNTSDVEIKIVYKPQFVFNIGLLISSFTFLIIILFLIFERRRFAIQK